VGRFYDDCMASNSEKLQMIDRAKTEHLIASAAQSIYEERGVQFPLGNPRDIQLYGREGALDSLALVTLIAEVEQCLDDELGLPLVLADERAMSRHRSPFRTIGSFVDYVLTLADEGGGQDS
jgi:acyl carrier protein